MKQEFERVRIQVDKQNKIYWNKEERRNRKERVRKQNLVRIFFCENRTN